MGPGLNSTFVLMDLQSQALSVERLLRGRTTDEKIAWLTEHGKIALMPKRDPQWPNTYFFETYLGLSCAFFFREDKLVFLGDNTTYTVDD